MSKKRLTRHLHTVTAVNLQGPASHGEIRLAQPVVKPEHDQTPEHEIDDTGDAPAVQTLETIRRAAALDLADDDTLPEF